MDADNNGSRDDTLSVVINGVTYSESQIVLTKVASTNDTYEWALTSQPLANGTYNVLATVTRTLSGTTTTIDDSTSGELVINSALPSQVPSITHYSDDASPQTGSFDSGHPTNDTAPVLNGILDSLLDSGDVLRLYRSLDRGLTYTLLGNATVSGTSWSYADSGLSSGSTAVYRVRVFDGSNEGTLSDPFVITVDTAAPTTTVSIGNYTDNVGASTGNFNSGTTTDDTTPLLNGSFSFPSGQSSLNAGEKVGVYRGGTLVGYGEVVPTINQTDGSITGYTWTYQ
jgi:hypothetical protein